MVLRLHKGFLKLEELCYFPPNFFQYFKLLFSSLENRYKGSHLERLRFSEVVYVS
jgi:hypothetical protein